MAFMCFKTIDLIKNLIEIIFKINTVFIYNFYLKKRITAFLFKKNLILNLIFNFNWY